MAIPNLTPNSPAAGSIAWSAFSIRYGGVTYGVGATSTSHRYVWWVYNGGSPVLSAGPVVPELGPDDLLLFLNKDGIPINLQASTVVDGSLIVDGTIVAPALAVGIIDSTHIVTDGLDAGVIKFGTMTGDVLESTAIDGMTITGALFRTAASGARVQIDAQGLLQYDAVETLLTRIGGAGNKFTGVVDAETMLVRGGLELFGQDNIFGANTKVTLRTGAGGSTTPPTISTIYQEQGIRGGQTIGFRPLMGYHTDGTNEYAAAGFFDESKLYNNDASYEMSSFKEAVNGHPTPGTTISKYKFGGGAVRLQTVSGGRTAVLCEYAPGAITYGQYRPVYVRVFNDAAMNTSGTAAPTDVGGLEVGPFSFNLSATIGRVIQSIEGTSGSRAMYALATLQDDMLSLAALKVNADNTSHTIHTNTVIGFTGHRVSPDEKLIGVTYGLASALLLYQVDGSNPDRHVYVVNTTHQNLVFFYDGSARYPQYEWPVIPGTNHRVFAHGTVSTNTFTYFAHLTASNNYDQPVQRLQKYSNWFWVGTTNPIWFNFAWRGHSTKAPEWLTSPSPIASIAPVKRSVMRVSMPALPPPEGGATAARDINKDVYGWVLYAGQGATQPANTGMYRQTALSPAGNPTTVSSVDVPGAYVLSGANPVVATTGFPTASPARIVSSAGVGNNPYLEIDGNGNIKTQTLQLAGVVIPSNIVSRITTLENDTGWVNLTFENGWGNWDAANWGTAAYRIKNGTVYLRGLVTQPTAGRAAFTVATLPVGVRPPNSVMVGAATGAGVTRYDINNNGVLAFPTMTSVGTFCALTAQYLL